MKLRGRFTLTLALAALVPITVATIITRQTIASATRGNYEQERASALQLAQREVATMKSEVADTAAAFADDSNQVTGSIFLAYETHGTSNPGAIVRQLDALSKQGGLLMRGLSLQALTVVGINDEILITPHYRDASGDIKRTVRELAVKTNGEAYFTLEEIRTGPTVETVLVVQSSRLSRRDGKVLALSASRAVNEKRFASIRTPRTDMRVVLPNGTVSLPPQRAWTATAPITVPLRGATGDLVATVEVTVGEENIDALLLNLTILSIGLAVGALVLVVLVGLLVARRTARDLESLVEGSLAASRGDLDHRVPVRSSDEVGAVAAAFNFMMEDLRTSKDRLVIAERIAAWQEIARRLAHEIKNPLTPIQMAMDTLRKTWKKQHPEFAEILDESTTTVLQEADRLKHIVSEFSDFARMPKPEFGRVDLNDIVRSATTLYQGSAPVEVTLAPKLPHLDADKNQLNQVVLNLVENARDAIANRTNGKVTVTTRMGETADRAVVIVEDNGPGVPPDLKDKVFAPYFTTKHSKGGTGLGLAIVHRIVSDHGGRITVSDRKGGGARFTIELPLRDGTTLLTSRI